MQKNRNKRKILKNIFYFTSLVLCIAIFIWPKVIKKTNLKHDAFFIHNTADFFSYRGIDSKNQPFVLNSSKALEVDRNIIKLSNPNLFLTQQDGTQISISASKGLFDRSNNIINLEGQVRTIHSKGYRLQSKKASIKLESTDPLT